MPHKHPPLTWLIFITLTAAALSAGRLHADVRFHADEAYFAAFARNAAVRGAWWLDGELDKPPLAIYGQALMMLSVGIRWDGAVWRLDPLGGEFAARLWSYYAGVLLIPTSYALARRMYRAWRPALWAALLVALSPYSIAFGPTAFTDTPMLLGVMAALLLAMRGHSGWAALMWAAALGAKPQALLFAPLLIVLVWRTTGWRGVARAAGGMALGVATLLLWDVLRPYPSVWSLGAANNAPSALLAAPHELWPRALAWGALLRYAFGGGALTVIVTAFGLRGRWTDTRRIVGVFVVGYALMHWLVPLNIYDRYVWAIVPLWALVVAGGWADVRGIERGVTILVLAAFALNAAGGRVPLGGDKGNMHGIDRLAAYLNGREFGAIVYDRWLGWPLNYYLGGWSDKRRAYYPTPDAMTSDPALTVPDVAPRYFPVPRDVDASAWVAALESAGFSVTTGYQSARFTVYVLRE